MDVNIGVKLRTLSNSPVNLKRGPIRNDMDMLQSHGLTGSYRCRYVDQPAIKTTVKF